MIKQPRSQPPSPHDPSTGDLVQYMPTGMTGTVESETALYYRVGDIEVERFDPDWRVVKRQKEDILEKLKDIGIDTRKHNTEDPAEIARSLENELDEIEEDLAHLYREKDDLEDRYRYLEDTLDELYVAFDLG